MVYTSSFLSHTFFFHEYRTKYELINFVSDPRDRYVIRTIEGLLSHPSENGDGVRGRIVSGTGGILRGEWVVHHSSTPTLVERFAVSAGETIDFIT